MEIWLDEDDGKVWLFVKILTADRYAAISFRQLYELVRGLIICERAKYPGIGRDPAWLVQKFFAQAASGLPWEYVERDTLLVLRKSFTKEGE